MKKLKTASSKATQKLKRTFSKLTHHKGGGGDYHQASSPSTAERDHERAEGLHYRAGTSMDAAALGYSTPQAEAPATSLEWAAAAGVMTREQWAGHLRELESSGGVRARYHSGSSAARRGDDEEEEDAQREEERRRRREKREKREKEARRKRREEAAVDERKAPAARRNSRHSHRSRRSSSSSEATTTSSSSGSSNTEEREREERRRKRRREKEKRRRKEREREEREQLRRKRESRRASLEARYLADNVQWAATADAAAAAATQREYEEADDDELLQVPVEEDEEAYHRGYTSSLGSTPASDGEGRRSGYSGAVGELEDVLDEARVKSPARDRPSERYEGANDEEDGYEDYDYASSGPIGAGTTESDGSLVVSTTLDRLPPATAPNVKAGVKPILTSLGASPPPDASGESDDDEDEDRGALLATTTVTAKTAGTESGVGGAVTEQQEMALSPVKQGMTLDGEETIAGGGAGGKRRMSGIFLSDTDSGARAESAPGGDAAHS